MGIKITEYPNTQTTFDNNDEFDVSAYVAPATPYDSRKFTWATLKTAIISLIGQIWPSGTTGQTIKKGASAWEATSDIFNSSGNIGIGTVTPSTRLDVQKNINGVDPVAFFKNSRNTGTNTIASNVMVGTAEVGSVSSLGYANQYGEVNDVFLKADKSNNGNINVCAGFQSTQYEGMVRFYPLAVTPSHNIHAPLSVQGTDGKLIWKEMITNGMAYTDGFKIMNVLPATKTATGDYIEIQIAGVTRYIPLFN
jgi:hypothetical protein